jgi:hypothetical protein
MTTDRDFWQNLTERERRGSRARCILLTQGSNEKVARQLSDLAAPFAVIDPNRHHWMPRGFVEPREAKLGDALLFLSDEHREAISAWWLAVRDHANTPNWDIASTATIDGAEGLLLVEAKAHAGEIRRDGKAKEGRLIQVDCVNVHSEKQRKFGLFPICRSHELAKSATNGRRQTLSNSRERFP